jgi:hypothetical protein
MDDLLDMVASDESPSQISDKIKELLFSKSAERIDAYRPEVAAAVFDGEDVVDELDSEEETEDEVEEEEGEE